MTTAFGAGHDGGSGHDGGALRDGGADHDGGAEHDSTADVLVIGAGVAGLAAAHQLVDAGHTVTILEAANEPGGMVGKISVDGIDVDAGAESFATRTPTVADLARSLGLAVGPPSPSPARVHHDGRSYPLPATGVLGIPADLDAPGLGDVLGADGLLQARQDELLPAHAGTDERTLAGLIRARMGTAVLDRLVRPVVRGVHSVEPEDVAIDALIANLPAKVARAGSLAAAVGEVRASAPAGSAVMGIDGGMYRLVEALVAQLAASGTPVQTNTPVRSLRRGAGADPQWIAETASGGFSARRVLLACAPHTWRFLDAESRSGTGGLPQLAELADAWPRPANVELVTLVLHASDVAEHTRAGVLVAEPGQGAKALTYSSAKWPWLADITGPDRIVMRLSYPAELSAPGAEGAAADAARLLGVPIALQSVRDHRLIRMTLPRPILAWGMSDRVAQMRTALAATDALDATGAWIAGTGLASVVPDAYAAAHRLVNP